MVTFLTTETIKPRRMVYSQFAGKRMSSEEDFLIAEWREEYSGKTVEEVKENF